MGPSLRKTFSLLLLLASLEAEGGRRTRVSPKGVSKIRVQNNFQFNRKVFSNVLWTYADSSENTERGSGDPSAQSPRRGTTPFGDWGRRRRRRTYSRPPPWRKKRRRRRIKAKGSSIQNTESKNNRGGGGDGGGDFQGLV